MRPPQMPVAVAALLVVTLLVAATTARAEPSLAADPPRGDVRLVVLSDFNGPYGSVDYPAGLARAMAAIVDVWRPDLLLAPGDVIAGQDRSLPDERFAAMWAAFDAAVAAPLRERGVPYAVAMGNHDASSLRSAGAYTFARERQAALDYWTANRPSLGFADHAAYPFDYSFTSRVRADADSAADPTTSAAAADPTTPAAAHLFIVILDASSSSVTPDQRAWLRSALASPSAVAAAARIVVGHLPLVPVSQGREAPGEYVSDGPELARLLVAGGVDLYVSGHHAAYYPGRWGELELLFAGGIGGRRLLGSDVAPRSTVTVVDLWLGDGDGPPTFVYTTFDLATMALVDPAELPAAVGEVSLSERAGR